MTQTTYYRCFFIAAKGIVGSDGFESVDDATAVERATTLVRERGIDHSDLLGFEVWQGDRMVHRNMPVHRA